MSIPYNDKELLESTKKHEGFRHTPYICSGGAQTIGYGTNLDAGITKRQASALMIQQHKDNLAWLAETYEWWHQLQDEQQRGIAEMVYQLGRTSFSKFKNTIAAIERKDYEAAAQGMENSLWARQTPNRVKHVAECMRSGIEPDLDLDEDEG